MVSGTSRRDQVEVCLGQIGQPVGTLGYARQGRREYSIFSYGKRWLSDPTLLKSSTASR